MTWRSWIGAVVAVLVVVTGFEFVGTMHTSGAARADVCVNVGRRISVSGCTNIGDAIANYAPPPSSYAPLPEDYPPPPP